MSLVGSIRQTWKEKGPSRVVKESQAAGSTGQPACTGGSSSGGQAAIAGGGASGGPLSQGQQQPSALAAADDGESDMDPAVVRCEVFLLLPSLSRDRDDWLSINSAKMMKCNTEVFKLSNN